MPDGLIDRVEDPVLAEPSGQPRPPRHSAHGLADVSERDVDACRVHRLDELGEHLGAGDVKAIGAADVDDQCPGGRVVAADERLDLVSDGRGVCVEQRGLEPKHQHVGNALVVRMSPDLAVGPALAGHAGERSDVGPGSHGR